jgi:hypothetical protein
MTQTSFGDTTRLEKCAEKLAGMKIWVRVRSGRSFAIHARGLFRPAVAAHLRFLNRSSDDAQCVGLLRVSHLHSGSEIRPYWLQQSVQIFGDVGAVHGVRRCCLTACCGGLPQLARRVMNSRITVQNTGMLFAVSCLTKG